MKWSAARSGSLAERTPLPSFAQASITDEVRALPRIRGSGDNTRQMRAMVLDHPGQPPRFTEIPTPEPAEGQVRLRVRACGVCRTDLHIVDGELSRPKLPLVLGHQIVGVVDRVGRGVTGIAEGARVGLPWLGSTCGECEYCKTHRENLCDRPSFTGYDRDGGYADFTLADPSYCLPLPAALGDVEAAPLLCAGLIGYRALRFTGDAKSIGLYGFGSAAHIVAQVARHEGKRIFAFTRPGDSVAQTFARSLGAEWAGSSTEKPPEPLDAAMIFASSGALIPAALAAVAKGGVVVCGGIHMSDIPSFPYSLLWGERHVRSVANLTRRDGLEFLELASRVPIVTTVTPYDLEHTGDALEDLRAGRLSGSAVVRVDSSARR